MLIRKNTKIFKSIQEIVDKCRHRADRQKLIRLYITKAGHSIKDRISVEGIESDSAMYYDLTYDAVWNNLLSAGRQLHQSDDTPGIYFFNTNQNKAWEETPFEFDEAVKSEFAGLPDMPVVRKKGKVEKYVIPVLKEKSKTATPKKEPEKKEKDFKAKMVVVRDKLPPQPNYHLKHRIFFTELDKILFTTPPVTKKEALDYYSKISEYILPYLKDRPLAIRGILKGRDSEISIVTELPEYVQVPEWIDAGSGLIFCNDKDHLLWYVEAGAIEFTSSLAKMTSEDFADHMVLVIESPDSTLDKALEVAIAANQILTGLTIPSFIKSDGRSGLHIYIPLEPKTKFEISKAVSEYLCKLIRLKLPGVVAIEGTNDNSYGLVGLKYQINDRGRKLVAPYSLVVGSAPVVAAPFPWEIAQKGIQAQGFNHDNIFKFVNKAGDPLAEMSDKKTNAVALLKKIEANYSFLL